VDQSDIPVATRLASHSPSETDDILRSRASRLGVGLTVRSEGRYPEGRATFSVTTGCEVSGSVTMRETVAAAYRAAMTAATRADVEGWLAELSVVVVPRHEDFATMNLRLAAYSERLVAFPADVVRHALLVHVWKFFPAWAELQEVCDALVSTRRAILRALDIARLPEPPEPMRERVDCETAARILAEAGFTPRRFAAVVGRPMARSIEEAEAAVDAPPRPHWTETVAPGSQEMAELRAARAANPAIIQARAAAEHAARMREKGPDQ